MATPAGLNRHRHLDEFNAPLPSAEGMLSPADRKERVRANIGAVGLTDPLGLVYTSPDEGFAITADMSLADVIAAIGAFVDPAD